jgi:hypothetical protein
MTSFIRGAAKVRKKQACKVSIFTFTQIVEQIDWFMTIKIEQSIN